MANWDFVPKQSGFLYRTYSPTAQGQIQCVLHSNSKEDKERVVADSVSGFHSKMSSLAPEVLRLDPHLVHQNFKIECHNRFFSAK